MLDALIEDDDDIPEATSDDIDTMLQLEREEPMETNSGDTAIVAQTPPQVGVTMTQCVLRARRNDIIRPLPRESRSLGCSTWFHAAVIQHNPEVEEVLKTIREDFGG